jgi:hypothetical protein
MAESNPWRSAEIEREISEITALMPNRRPNPHAGGKMVKGWYGHVF